jgi:hypothetical protein
MNNVFDRVIVIILHFADFFLKNSRASLAELLSREGKKTVVTVIYSYFSLWFVCTRIAI